MLKNHSSRSGNRVIRRYDWAYGKEVHVALNNARTAAHENLARAARPVLADLNLRSAVMPKATEADRLTSFLSLLFTVLMEGFAFWGPSPYPIAAFPIEAVTESETTQKKRSSSRERRGFVSPVSSLARPESATEHERDIDRLATDGCPVESDRAPALNVGQSSRRNWLAWSWRGVVKLWTHGRREREFKKAVAALAKLDDRTLRDMGISHRSQIERVVRYCRDC